MALLAHAGRVDALATAVGNAEGAAAAVVPGPMAYGQLCTIVPAMLDRIHTALTDGLQAAGTSLSDTAERVREAAHAYQGVDEDNAAALRGSVVATPVVATPSSYGRRPPGWTGPGGSLVADAVPAPVDGWAGVWIAEDIQLIGRGIRDGSWIDLGLGGVSAGLDVLALALDPVGVLLQYGLAWLIDHVRPLTQVLDWLAGDAAAIAAIAHTWQRIGAHLRTQAGELADAVDAGLADWTGAAATAYRAWSTSQQRALAGLGDAADTMAAVTEGAGQLIAGVRALVRDAIAALVSRLIVYAVEELASGLLATPLVVKQAATLIASWAARISRWLHALLASLRNLLPLVTRLSQLIDDLTRILNRLRTPGEGQLRRHGDAIARGGRRILMTMTNVRTVAAKYGIDLEGVEVVIDKRRAGGGPGREFYGVTTADGKIVLARDAFLNEEQFARTLVHERFHVADIRRGLPVPTTRRELDQWEKRAYDHERQWWEEHKHLLNE